MPAWAGQVFTTPARCAVFDGVAADTGAKAPHRLEYEGPSAYETICPLRISFEQQVPRNPLLRATSEHEESDPATVSVSSRNPRMGDSIAGSHLHSGIRVRLEV